MVKKLLTAILITAVIISVFTTNIIAAAKPTENIKRGSAVIDGYIDEIWDYVDEMVLDRFSIEGDTTASGYAKMLWDDENLYAIVVITDTTKNNETEALHTEDCLEVFIDLDNKKTTSYSEHNQFRFLYDIISPIGMRNLENISDNATDYIEITGREPNDTQYIYEFKINYKIGIDFKLTENMEIGIDFGYDDNTKGDGVRTAALSWNAEGDVPSNPSFMGTIKLINEEAMPIAVIIEEIPQVEENVEIGTTESITTVIAPATSDMGIGLIIVALLSLTVYKKIRNR